MTVFIAFANADRALAETLERYLDRRGQFVELDDGAEALRPIEPGDVVVLLNSADFAVGSARLRLEQRALDAWADGRLALVRLDGAEAPVGLRDLPFIDARQAEDRELAWASVLDLMEAAAADRRDAAEQQPRRDATLPPAPAAETAAPRRAAPKPKRGGFLWFGRSKQAAETGAAAAPAPAPKAEESVEPVFVSYARANSDLVLPVIDAAKQSGPRFWLDQQSIAAGESWAGEIVRAIRGARCVLVMCSRAAFESDHVKREVYLADRYKKRLAPIFIEEAVPPEDFEYFFVGVQGLKLFETPEPERPAAVLRILEAA